MNPKTMHFSFNQIQFIEPSEEDVNDELIRMEDNSDTNEIL